MKLKDFNKGGKLKKGDPPAKKTGDKQVPPWLKAKKK